MADASTSDRYERGLKKMSEVYGVDGGEVVEPLHDLGRYMVEFPYGDIYSRDGLGLRDREIATTAMLTALGREPQLRVHFVAALTLASQSTNSKRSSSTRLSLRAFPPPSTR